MWKSQIASPVILFPFFIFARILYNLQAVCVRWETICPRARAREIVGCFLPFSWERWSLKSNSQRKVFACKSSSLAWLDLIQSTFNTFLLFILSRQMVTSTPRTLQKAAWWKTLGLVISTATKNSSLLTSNSRIKWWKEAGRTQKLLFHHSHYASLLQLIRWLIKPEIWDKLIILLHLIASWIKTGLKVDHCFMPVSVTTPHNISVNLRCQMTSSWRIKLFGAKSPVEPRA